MCTKDIFGKIRLYLSTTSIRHYREWSIEQHTHSRYRGYVCASTAQLSRIWWACLFFPCTRGLAQSQENPTFPLLRRGNFRKTPTRLLLHSINNPTVDFGAGEYFCWGRALFPPLPARAWPICHVSREKKKSGELCVCVFGPQSTYYYRWTCRGRGRKSALSIVCPSQFCEKFQSLIGVISERQDGQGFQQLHVQEILSSGLEGQSEASESIGRTIGVLASSSHGLAGLCQWLWIYRQSR